MAEDRSEDRDVMAGTEASSRLRDRDKQRRKRIEALHADGWPDDPDALYAVAWVLNHGQEGVDAFLGHQLAARARDLGHAKARWFAAAAIDP